MVSNITTKVIIGSASIFTDLEIGQVARMLRLSNNFCSLGLIAITGYQVPGCFVYNVSIVISESIMTPGCNINRVSSSRGSY